MQQREQAPRTPRPAATQPSTTSAARPATAGQGTPPGEPVAPASPGPTGAAPAPKAAAPDGKITIDDFLKVELLVGQVKAAEKVKGADRLLRLEVDIGTEVRQVVAGNGLSYELEPLIRPKVVLAANLPPRQLRRTQAYGMIFAPSD